MGLVARPKPLAASQGAHLSMTEKQACTQLHNVYQVMQFYKRNT